MKKRQIIALLCTALLLAGCADLPAKGESDFSEGTGASESLEDLSSSDSSEETLEELSDSSEESSEESTEESSEESDVDSESDASTAATTEEVATTITLEPAGIIMVSDKADAPDTDLYFIYEDEGNKSSSITDSVSIDTITLVNGENTATIDVNGFFYPSCNSCTRLTTDDNREYIYFETDSDNDYFHLFVFDITDGNAKFVGDNWYSYTGVNSFDDPNNIEITQFTECLCMFSFTLSYMVGPDGMPVPKSDIAMINGDRSVISQKALELEVVDEEGNGTGNMITVPKGSKYTLVHVYKDCGIDAKLDDGTIVRIPVTSITYDAECNGESLNDLFSTDSWE